MSEDGVLIVVTTLANNGASSPELISRGFAENDDELFSEMRAEVTDIVRELLDDDMREVKLLQEHIHDGLGQLIYDRTRRRPMILPIVIEV
jgi:ribonuclease J